MIFLIWIGILFFTLPMGLSWLTKRFVWLDKVGTVILCYALGIVFGAVLPKTVEIAAMSDSITSGTVLLAIPLLLFESEWRNLSKIAFTSILSMFLSMVMLTIAVYAGFVIWGDEMADGAKVAGLFMGVYTGGTPNLASIKSALNIDAALYISVHTMDTVVTMAYLMVLLSGGKFLFRRFLKSEKVAEPLNEQAYVVDNTLKGWIRAIRYPSRWIGFLLAVVVAGMAAASGFLVGESVRMAVIILMLTTLSIVISIFISKPLVKGSYNFGMYFIHVFSFVVASMADFSHMHLLDSPLFFYITFVIFITFVGHIFLAKLFRIDSDTVMVTSVALICSPPFVPVVVSALKARHLLIPGITVGIIGYAVGNYLGVLMYLLLK